MFDAWLAACRDAGKWKQAIRICTQLAQRFAPDTTYLDEIAVCVLRMTTDRLTRPPGSFTARDARYLLVGIRAVERVRDTHGPTSLILAALARLHAMHAVALGNTGNCERRCSRSRSRSTTAATTPVPQDARRVEGRDRVKCGEGEGRALAGGSVTIRLVKIMKFGGSSLATPQPFVRPGRSCAMRAEPEPLVVVVSAFQGVTNQLLEAARLAERATNHTRVFDELARRHRAAVAALVTRRRVQTRKQVDVLLAELGSTLQGIHLLRHCPLRALDMTASFGERLSALIVAAYVNRFHPAICIDARTFVRTDDQFTHAAVNFPATNRLARTRLGSWLRKRQPPIPIVTGFIGATDDGQTTTIGRNGSDYSASIVGAAVGADTIEIWTDVDGVLSADPRIVPAAFVLPEMSYEEAMELSYFGAKVIHSATIAPAVAKRIPILIKNTFNPSAPGTLISNRRTGAVNTLAKGITTVGDLSLLTVSGPGMVGMPGVAERLFRTLAASRVNIILISQASSEHTICFAVRSDDATRGVEAIEREFRHEVDDRLMHVDPKHDQRFSPSSVRA